MKKLLAFTVALALASFSASAFADTVTLMVVKHGDAMATLTPNPGKDSCTVPVKFDTGASWDNVHDSYDVSPETAAKLKAGEEYILVGSDGGISYHPTHHHMK
jgi:hypothetical protein